MEYDWDRKVPESCAVALFGEAFADRPPVTNNIDFGQKAYERFQSYSYLEQLLTVLKHPTVICGSPLFGALHAGHAAFEGVEESRQFNFTSAEALDRYDACRLAQKPRGVSRRLDHWRSSVRAPRALKRVIRWAINRISAEARTPTMAVARRLYPRYGNTQCWRDAMLTPTAFTTRIRAQMPL